MYKLTQLILDCKFFLVKGQILWKRASLSTGEEIASAAANILRDHVLQPILIEHGDSLKYFKGYIDDCFGIWLSSPQSFYGFKHAFATVKPNMLQWEWSDEASPHAVNFLDLSISLDSLSTLQFATFVKPYHVAQVLHAGSQHPSSQKLTSIFNSECVRHLVNSSTSHAYDASISKLATELAQKGYDKLHIQQLVASNVYDVS